MPVPLSLLEKLAAREQEGFPPDKIVAGLAQSENYPDIAKKTQEFIAAGYSPEDIIKGLRASPTATEEQKFFRGFERGVPVIKSEAELKEKPKREAGPPAPERAGGIAPETEQIFPEYMSGPQVELAAPPKKAPGIYAEERGAMEDIVEAMTPFGRQFQGAVPWRSPETAIEAIGWVGGSKLFREMMRGLAGSKVTPEATKLITELLKRPYAEPAILLGKEEAPKGEIVESFLRQRADAALKTPPFLRTAEDLLVLQEVKKQGPAMPSAKLPPKVEVPVTPTPRETITPAGIRSREILEAIGAEPKGLAAAPAREALPPAGEEFIIRPKTIREPGYVAGEVQTPEVFVKTKEGIVSRPQSDAEFLHGKLTTEGGFSWRPDTATPTKGYMVGVPGFGETIEGTATPSQIAGWKGRVANAVAGNKRYFYGGYIDEGNSVLDVSEWIPTEKAAIKALFERGEKEYYDLTKGVSINPRKPAVEILKSQAGKVELGVEPPGWEKRTLPHVPSYTKSLQEVAAIKDLSSGKIYTGQTHPTILSKYADELNPLIDAGKAEAGWFVKGKFYTSQHEALVAMKQEGGIGGLGLLPRMAGTAVGAATGGVVDEENPVRGAVLGGAAGFVITHGLASRLLKGGTKFPSEAKRVPGGIEIPPLKKGPIDWDLQELGLKYKPEKEVATRATAQMILGGEQRDPTMLFSEQVIDALHRKPENFVEIFKSYNTTPDEFIKIFRESRTAWGRNLGLLGNLSKKLQGIEDPVTKAMIKQLLDVAGEPTVFDHLQYWWRRVDNVRRGLLVTQLSTAMRNFITQSARVGLDVFEQAFSSGLQQIWKGVGGKVAKPADPLAGVEQFFGLFHRHKADVDKVLKAFPQQYDRLLGTYSSDVSSVAGKSIDSAVQLINTPNRLQEFLFRRTVFMSDLGKSLEARGMNLTEMIRKNLVGQIPMADIQHAVNKSLEMTFAEQPKWGSIGQKFISFINSLPTASWVLPFPRFMVNSLKFNFEYSPLGILKLLSKAEWNAFKEGNMKVVSRAILGSAMLGTAWQFRNSEYAGEKWYELKLPDGKIIDMRPYNPFGAYMFIADLAKKIKNDELYKMTWNDLIQGLASTNLRAGVGLWAVDKVLNILTEFGDEPSRERAFGAMKQLAGEVVGGFATPMNMVREFLAGFDETAIRERREEPFLGPIKARIPGLAETLPAAHRPTREAPIEAVAPAFRQMTGLAISPPKNALEKELDRLGFDRREILPATGNPEADRYLAEKMGWVAENFVVPIIASPDFQELGDHQKGILLVDLLKDMRKDAREMAEAEHSELFAKLKEQKIPKREKLFLRKEGLLQ